MYNNTSGIYTKMAVNVWDSLYYSFHFCTSEFSIIKSKQINIRSYLGPTQDLLNQNLRGRALESALQTPLHGGGLWTIVWESALTQGNRGTRMANFLRMLTESREEHKSPD